jgi:hypothetical protein
MEQREEGKSTKLVVYRVGRRRREKERKSKTGVSKNEKTDKGKENGRIKLQDQRGTSKRNASSDTAFRQKRPCPTNRT